MRHDTPFPLYAPVHVLDDPPPLHCPSCVWPYNGWHISQPKTIKNIRIKKIRIIQKKKVKKNYEKINGTVG